MMEHLVRTGVIDWELGTRRDDVRNCTVVSQRKYGEGKEGKVGGQEDSRQS